MMRVWKWGVSLVAVAVLAAGGMACRSAPPPVLSPAEIEAGIGVLTRPLPGDLAALYRLTIPSSGGLRLSILTRGTDGRLTISEPFGSAVSLAAWGPAVELFDLRHGCRLGGAAQRGLFWGGQLPFAELARLFGGRLPSVPGDRIEAAGNNEVIIRGKEWSCRAVLARDPWRVTHVSGPAGIEQPRWGIRLGNHTSSLPGFLRAEWGRRRWAELTLVRLEWKNPGKLPPPPDLPPCGGGE